MRTPKYRSCARIRKKRKKRAFKLFVKGIVSALSTESIKWFELAPKPRLEKICFSEPCKYDDLIEG